MKQIEPKETVSAEDIGTPRWHANLGKLAAGAVLLVSLAVTLAGWHYSRVAVEHTRQERFDAEARDIIAALSQRMTAYEAVLRGGIGLFDSSRDVTRAEWRNYVASLQLSTDFPGIQGMGFSQLIRPGDMPAHLRAIRAEGFPRYAVRPAGGRPIHTSIVYLEPFDWRNQRAFGYDMFSEPVRRQAMERARDTGEAALSGKVWLVQETEKDKQAGFLMYLPLYAKGKPHATVAERRDALLGYVYAPFRMGDLMRGILRDKLTRFDIHIYDGDTVSPEALLFDNDLCGGKYEEGYPISRSAFDLHGHHWTIRIRPLTPLLDQDELHTPYLVGGGGILVSLLLFAIAWSLATNRERAVAIARQMTQALRDSETRYRQMFEKNHSVKLLIDPADGAIVDANPAAVEFYGHPLERLKAMRIGDINILSAEEIQREMALAREEKRLYFQFRHRLASGEIRDVEVYSGPVDFGGRTLLHSIVHDITQRKRAEQALRESETRLREITATLAEGLFVLDMEGRVTFSNPEAHRLLGWSQKELEGTDAHELFHRHQADGAPYPKENCPFLATLRQGKTHRQLEELFWRKDGSPLPVSVSTAPLVRSGRVEGVLIAFQDTSERLAVRQQLEHTLAEQRAILGGVTVGIALLQDRRFVWANRRMEELFGYTQAELAGKASALIYAQNKSFEEVGANAYPRMEAGQIFHHEYLLRRKDGSQFWGELTGNLIDRRKPELGSIWTIEDITPRKAAEDSLKALNETLEQRVRDEVSRNRDKDHLLIQQSRLAAMGEMIHNIAHQWRQPLNALALLLANLRDAWQYGELDGAYLDREVEEGRRIINHMSTTIDDFRDFFRPDRQKTCFSAADALKETLALVESAFSNNQIEVITRIEQDGKILGFSHQYSQALLNILSNAKDILKERQVANGRVAIHLTTTAGEVRLTIEDNAGGIAPEAVDKIFDPYFTTREKGTGIGLYMTKMIVEKNLDGKILVQNTGEGAKFTLIAPLAADEAQTP